MGGGALRVKAVGGADSARGGERWAAAGVRGGSQGRGAASLKFSASGDPKLSR